ncbi:Expressed conserved protein [Fasciola hepatica]|uniref:Expressed conserved protein n=1 Tax=Fasciola hepatica TaxID=6192 RepID=A0A4E0RUP8_FASHE|nr:Expressed conserved protein [Fasciola hepatica]
MVTKQTDRKLLLNRCYERAGCYKEIHIMGETYVVMTPINFDNMKTIRFERTNQIDQSRVHHVAGGQHAGIIVNQECKSDSMPPEVPEMQLEFTCVMYNSRTTETHAENRRLKFWFTKCTQQFDRLDESYAFFRELINPDAFPRDYAGFIKKVLKQLHGPNYLRLRRIDLDIVPLDKRAQDALAPEQDNRPTEQVVREALQMRLEEAYPNVLSMDDLVRILEVDDRNLIQHQLEALEDRDLVQFVPLEGRYTGQIGFRRKIHLQNQEVKEVKGANHMQQISTSEKPTIAIITNLLCEKLAVDAMIEQKTTFVRYKTEGGESNVYTIGNIGPHRVISTKLPMVGRELQAKISSGSITTRLLGAFQAVQHVFLVGVGGSVPHVYEFEKHSRLGDIVVSAPVKWSTSCRSPSVENKRNGNHGNNVKAAGDMCQDPVYIYCDRLVDSTDGEPRPAALLKYILKKYAVRDTSLLSCADRVLDRFEEAPERCEWAQILQASMNRFAENEAVDFTRPSSDTDKLKLKIDEGVTFDIKHPDVPEHMVRFYPPGVPAVRLGCLGSGRPITDNDQLRDSFAKEHQLLCFDAEYDQVLESVLGNGLDSFLIIRGIADYVEGRQGTHWQPYAALAAASFMKAVIMELPPVRVRDD